MSDELPAAWTTKRLETIAEVRGGVAFPIRYQGRPDGRYPFFKVSDMTLPGNERALHTAKNWIDEGIVKRLKAGVFPKGTVVFPKVGAAIYTNKKRLLVRPSLVDNNVMGVSLREHAECIPEYLLFWFESIVLRDLSNPGPLPSINAGRVKQAAIVLAPLREQQVIVWMLSSLDSAASARRIELTLERERKAALTERLFRCGTRGEAKKQTEIGEMPGSWRVMQIGEIAWGSLQYGLSMLGGATGSYPILRMNNLVDGYIDTGDLQYVDLDAKTLEAFRLERGDILFNRTNSLDLVGKTSIFDLDGDYVLASYLVRVNVKREKAAPAYVNGFLNWLVTQRRLKMIATRAVSQSNISAGKLARFEVAVPALDEQCEIVEILSACDARIAALEREIELLEELFKAMLEELMTGRLSALPLIGEAVA